MDDCCGRLAAWPSSRRSPVKQPSHRAVGNPPISSAAPLAQHARARRRSKARRRSSARARLPGRNAARERDAQSRTRCQSGAGQSIESEAPENTMSFESEPPRSATLGNVIPGAQRPRARHSRARYPVQNATLRSTRQRGQHCQKTPRWGLTAEKSF